MMTFASLMNGHTSAEIRCPFRGEVVRRLTVKGDMVEVDAMTIKVDVRLETIITYEPWCMDRGSLLFYSPNLPQHVPVAKLCTELDVIKFEDGTERTIEPV